MSAWQLMHIYVPAQYKHPGMIQAIESTVLPRLYAVEDIDDALGDWLTEVSRHREGYRRFKINLMDNKFYQPIPVTFLLKQHGEWVM